LDEPSKLSTFIIVIPDGEGFNALPIFFVHHSDPLLQGEKKLKGKL